MVTVGTSTLTLQLQDYALTITWERLISYWSFVFKLVLIFSFTSCTLQWSPDPNCDVAVACRKWHVCLYKSSRRIVLQTLELSKNLDSKSKLAAVA